MGFLSGLGKVLAGKPVFTPEEESSKQNEVNPKNAVNSNVDQNQPIEHAGPKQIPQIYCGRVECLIKSGRCDLYIDVHNQSPQLVLIDDVNIFGVHRELQRQLRPGESHQELLYSGPLLTNEPRGYAVFRYRKQEDGDYFQSRFQIRFRRDQDGTYRITELLPAGPVRDI